MLLKFCSRCFSARVRFAPSPTEKPYVGGLRTALANYLFAKKEKGRFILRVEDTNNVLILIRKKYDPEGHTNITKTLHGAGIHWDEGPDIGGPYGPYT